MAKDVGIPHDKIYLLGGSVKGRPSFDGLIKRVREKNIPRIGVRPAKADTLAYLVFSSGTSGMPKGMSPTIGQVILLR